VSPTFPSVTDASAIEIVGAASSSWIVPRPDPSAMPAFEALERSTVNVSSASWVVSPLMVRSTVCVV